MIVLQASRLTSWARRKQRSKKQDGEGLDVYRLTFNRPWHKKTRQLSAYCCLNRLYYCDIILLKLHLRTTQPRRLFLHHSNVSPSADNDKPWARPVDWHYMVLVMTSC